MDSNGMQGKVALVTGRLGTEDGAAQAVFWLSAPASSYVIGHTLCVDGGFLAQ